MPCLQESEANIALDDLGHGKNFEARDDSSLLQESHCVSWWHRAQSCALRGAPRPTKENMNARRTPRREKVVQLLYGSGGGGHLASAEAVAASLRGTPGVRAELVNASAVVGALRGDALYNWFLSYNAVPLIEIMHFFATTFLPVAGPSLRASLRAHWESAPTPDAVVSFIPTLNACISQTLPKGVPFFTVLTDFSHTAAHQWLQHPRQHVIAGTSVAQRQAFDAGWREHAHPGTPEFTRTSGMVVHPRFYNTLAPEERSRLYSKMQLDSSLPTVLLLYGGSPPTDTVSNLFDLFTSRRGAEAVNVVVVCGRNSTLLGRLKSRIADQGLERVHVVGFSREIPTLMQLANVMVGKPGPGVVSEAFVSGVPVLLVAGDNDSGVMKQEKDVVAWVRDSGVGLVVRNIQQAGKISRSQMDLMSDNIRRMPKNEGVFEVQELLMKTLGRRSNQVTKAETPKQHVRITGLT